MCDVNGSLCNLRYYSDSVYMVTNEKVHQLLLFFDQKRNAMDSMYADIPTYMNKTYDSLQNGYIRNLDSSLVDTLGKVHWYNFYDNAFDKLVSSYTALFVALLTSAVALFLLKYWYDNKIFKENFDKAKKNIKEKFDGIADLWNTELSNVKETLEESTNRMNDLDKIKRDFSYKLDDIYVENYTIKEQLKLYVDYSKWNDDAHGPSNCKSMLQEICDTLIRAKEKDGNNDDKLVGNLRVKRILLWLIDNEIIDKLFEEVNKLDEKSCKELFSLTLSLKEILDRFKNSFVISLPNLDEYFKKFSA